MAAADRERPRRRGAVTARSLVARALARQSTDLRDQLRLAKFNIGIACGTIDELLAAQLLRRADAILAWRRAFLADALTVVETWVDDYAELVEWVRPQGGAFCCVRLAPGTFAPAHVGRFYAQVTERRTLVAPGQWFGDDPAVFRLGFGFDPIDKLQAGLGMTGAALRAASVP